MGYICMAACPEEFAAARLAGSRVCVYICIYSRLSLCEGITFFAE